MERKLSRRSSESKRDAFFSLPSSTGENPQRFTIQYHKTTPSRAFLLTLRKISSESLTIEKKTIEDKDIL